MVYVQTGIRFREWDAIIHGDYETKMDYLIPIRKQDLVIINNKKYRKVRTYYLVDFAVQMDHKLKIKESEETSTKT